jgi:predicted acetyltransferase
MPTPPHLAQLELTYTTPDTVEAYLKVVLRGFYDDYKPELWEAGRAVIEPERHFGHVVDGQFVTTCGAYSRVLTVPGAILPAAGVTFVTVHPSYRRRGLLREMMTHQLLDLARRGTEPLAILWASEASIYGRFGYGQAIPRLTLSGDTRETAFLPAVTLGAGSVGEVDRETYRKVASELHERWRPDRPGAVQRTTAWWEVVLHDPEPWRAGASALRFAVHYAADGQPDGYLAFRVKGGDVHPGGEALIVELDGADPMAYAALWRFVLDLDLVRTFRRDTAPVDDPLRHLLADQRAARTELFDGPFLRLVDMARALEARTYACDLDVVLTVRDALLEQNNRTIRLQAGPSGSSVTSADADPDLTLDVRELATIYLGGTSLATLQRAGWVSERTPGAVAAVDAAFTSGRAPFCADFF